MDLEQERIDILKDALDQRRRGVMHYQINIDNFRAAIALIETEHAADERLAGYADELRLLLEQNEMQQAREQVMLRVIEAWLRDADHVG